MFLFEENEKVLIQFEWEGTVRSRATMQGVNLYLIRYSQYQGSKLYEWVREHEIRILVEKKEYEDVII